MLILVRGLPGSGKSTFAVKEFPKFQHFETDMYFVKDGVYDFNPLKLKLAHEWCQKEVRKALTEGKDVVVSNTFSMQWEMDPYLDMADALGHNVKVYRLMNEYGSIHNVPEEAIERMRVRFQNIPGECAIYNEVENV